MTVTVARLRALAPALIVLEATGGEDTALVAAVAAASRPVVVANPREVRDVAKATGQRARTDRHRSAHAAAPLRRDPRHLRGRERRLGAADHDLDDTIQKSPVWRATEHLLRTVPGIGPVMSRTRLADLPALGRLKSHTDRGAGRVPAGPSGTSGASGEVARLSAPCTTSAKVARR